jgi:EmrB/QacA subfamily drug resistance transporter
MDQMDDDITHDPIMYLVKVRIKEKAMSTAADPPASLFSTRRGRLILLLLCGAQFLVVLDSTIVNVALPSIQRALHFSEQSLQWVASGYALTFAGFLLLGGRSADLLGRRRVFLTGVLVFSVSSLAGGLAGSEAMLIGARVAQGIGGAMMSPAALSLLTTMFEGRDRAKALGIYGAMAGLGGAAGVLFGGLLTSGPGWRWVLFVNIPVSAAILVAGPRMLDGARRQARATEFDAPGAVLITGALLLLVYALTKAPDVGWSATRTVVELAGAAALITAFVLNEARTKRPLLPLRTFRLPGVAAANASAIFMFSAVVPLFFFLTLYMQQALGYSALKAGLSFLPLTIGVIVTTPVTTRLISRFGPTPTMIAGPLVYGAAVVYFNRLPVHGTYVSDILPGLLIASVGAGLSVVSIINAATRGVARTDAGVAAGLVNTMQRVGTAVGLAVLSAVATSHTKALALSGHADRAHALVGGFDRAFLIAGGFALAAGVLAALTTSKRRALSPARGPAPAPAPSRAS